MQSDWRRRRSRRAAEPPADEWSRIPAWLRPWPRYLVAGEAAVLTAWAVTKAISGVFLPNHASALSDVGTVGVLTGATGFMVVTVVIVHRIGSRRVRIGLLDASVALRSMELLTDPALSFLPLDELLDELLSRTTQVVGGDVATIFLLSSDGRSLAVRAAYGAVTLEVGDEIAVGVGVIGTVAARAQARIVNDLTQLGTGMSPASVNVEALMAAPLLVAGRVIGVVQVGTQHQQGFSERDLHLLQLVAERAAASVERARLDESERRSRMGAEQARRHLDLLARAGDVLATALESYEETFLRLVEVVVPAFADWFAIDLADDQGEIVRVAYGARGEVAHGLARPERTTGVAAGTESARRHRHPDGDRLVRRSLHTGRPELVLNARRMSGAHPGQLADRGGYTDAAPAAGVESMMVVPVHVRGLAFGAVSLVTGPGRRGYRRSDLDTALGLAERVAVAVERVLLWGETRQAESVATRRAAQLRRLVEAALGVNAPLEEPEVLRVLAEQARQVLDADWALVCASGDEGPVTELLSPLGAPRAAGVGNERLNRACASVLVANLPVHGGDQPGQGVSWLGVQLTGTAGGPKRAILAFSADAAPFSGEDESVLLLLAQMASVALDNARLYQEVQGNEERLRAVVDSSPLAIAELDLDGRLQWWNSAAAELFGWPEVDTTGEEDPRVLARSTAIELRGLVDRARAGQATVGVELGSERSDGQRLELSVSTAPLRDHAGVVRGILAVMEDVTERLEMLEQFHQAERVGAMARMAGAVAHDFNNLLTVILGSSEILLRRLADEGSREEVAAIQRAGQRAAALTSQLLSIGQRAPVQPIITDPDVAIVAMTPMLARALGHDVVITHRSSSPPLRILVDPAELERAVLNLALNANDAMPTGGHFAITTSARVPGGQSADVAEVLITVSDEGVGMEEDVLAHCFEPFFTTKSRARGTGLGLAAVHAMVTQAGGRVTVASTPGVGTTFTLVFPATKGEPDTEAPALEPDLSTGDERVLVVEDEDELRRLAVQALEWRGYQVMAAGSGLEALEVVGGLDERPHLVVTDVVMPEMSGVELAERLRKRWRTLPVLFVSGHLDEEELSAGPLGEKADLLVKPFTPDQLGRRVRQAIDRSTRSSRRPAQPAADGGRSE